VPTQLWGRFETGPYKVEGEEQRSAATCTVRSLAAAPSTKKEAADRGGPCHIYIGGQVPGGLFTGDDDRLTFFASRMAQTRSATHCNLALIGVDP
jgi:hypothetical protein